jgi:23S rRNA (uracil1939-C5)-methyltransferase
MPPSPGALVSLTIDKPAVGGRMIARLDGQVVLVAGAIPGERVVARVERSAKGVVYAATVDVTQASPHRREALADPLCGGCVYSHIDYARQVAIKGQVIVDALARIARIALASPPVVRPSREDGYRMRARLHLRSGRVGFFREGTHDLCDPTPSRQLRPETIQALEQTAADHAGRSGEVELSENVAATERAIALDGRVLTAEPCVHDTIEVGGRRVTWRRHVLAFFQGNRYLLADLVNHVAAVAGDGRTVLDLYAGAGLFSLPAALTRSAAVVAVESDRYAVDDLRWNIAHAAGAHVTPVHQPVEAFLAKTDLRPDLVIVDPPRVGMSREAVDRVLRLHAARIVYVSCDAATLARDAKRLVDAGYALERVDAFDMFPNTPHVETVMVFSGK